MSDPIRKIDDNYTPQMRVIRGKNGNNNKTTLTIIVFIILIGIVVAPIILNSISDEPSNISMPTTDIDWDNPPCLPEDLSNEWQEVTPELMKQNSNRREFINKKTGLKIAFDKGIYGKPKFRGKNHWHIYNPNSTNINDYYLDKNGNSLHKNDNNSHIEINCK